MTGPSPRLSENSLPGCARHCAHQPLGTGAINPTVQMRKLRLRGSHQLKSIQLLSRRAGTPLQVCRTSRLPGWGHHAMLSPTEKVWGAALWPLLQPKPRNPNSKLPVTLRAQCGRSFLGACCVPGSGSGNRGGGGMGAIE